MCCACPIVSLCVCRSAGVQKAINSPGGVGVNPATLAAVRAEDEARRGRSRSPAIQVSQPPQEYAGEFDAVV